MTLEEQSRLMCVHRYAQPLIEGDVARLICTACGATLSEAPVDWSGGDGGILFHLTLPAVTVH